MDSIDNSDIENGGQQEREKEEMKSNVALKKLSDDEICELQEIFNLVDEDRGGTISRNELRQLLLTVGIHATKPEIEKMVKEMMADVDKDGDGQIEFPEFVECMSRKVEATFTPEQVMQSFKLFAGNSPPGYMTRNQLEAAFTQYGDNRLTRVQTLRILGNLQFENTELFNYEQYVNLMMKR